jgi:hypothetical protein
LGFRLRAQGLESVFDPDLVAVHRHPRRLRRVPADAHSLAYGAVCLQRAYPELVDAPEDDVIARLGGRQALWLARSRFLSTVIALQALAAARVASAMRVHALERLAVRAASLLGYARGIDDARKDFGDGVR